MDRKLARCQPDSKNRVNLARQRGRLHGQVVKTRSLYLHRVSNVLAGSFDVVTIEDLNSRNGVIVNGQRIDTKVQLNVGDRILIGSQELTLLAASAGVPMNHPDLNGHGQRLRDSARESVVYADVLEDETPRSGSLVSRLRHRAA